MFSDIPASPDVPAAVVEPAQPGGASADDKLPSLEIPPANLHAVPVTAALQAVLYGTDVSLSWDAKTLGPHPVTLVNLKGDLPKVVEKICLTANVNCAYSNGTLEVTEKKAFAAPSYLTPPPEAAPPRLVPPTMPAPAPKAAVPEPTPAPEPPAPVSVPEPAPAPLPAPEPQKITPPTSVFVPQMPITAQPPSPLKPIERTNDGLPPPILIDKDGARPAYPQRNPDRVSALYDKGFTLGTISKDDLPSKAAKGGRP